MKHTHIHKETGNLYKLLMVTNEEAVRGGWTPTAVYLDGEGSLWSRPLSEFKERYLEVIDD